MKDFHKHYMDYPKVYMEMKKRRRRNRLYQAMCYLKKKNNNNKHSKNHSVIESNKSLGWTRFHWVPTVCI